MNKHVQDTDGRVAKLFRNGRSQALRIPKEFEFEGSEVLIRRHGDNAIVVEQPRKCRTGRELVEFLRNLGPIEDFPGDPGEDDLPPTEEPRL